MQVTRLIVCVIAAIVTTAGCSNFDHPLPWDHSPLHEKLLGSWQSMDDAVTPMKVHVATEEAIKSDSSFPFSTSTRHVSFNGVALASNDVDVLQIDMKSYEERDSKDEKTRDSSREGYRFVHVVPADDSMVFHLLDIKSFARYVEAELSIVGTSVPASKFADCIDEEIRILIFARLLNDLLNERSSNLLTEDEHSELEQALLDDEKREVDPYEEMQNMRECVAHRLSGDVLGRMFSSAPDASFSGETIQLMKVK